MSYSALARKWRPKSFAELKGQDHVAKALMNALERDQLHHAYLFTGTRGIGKTTIARIFAKCLNCEQGVVAVPCNECQTCKTIDAGCYLDLIEVDAASKTKVEDTRELLDNVQYAPTTGRYKVYLIDEVHMLSGHSFNALLKTLEEPPAHVKFILATTDPEKIPVTILSRCLNFHLRPLSTQEINAQLALILEQEALPYEAPVLTLISELARGSMRDALSLLEQAISYCDQALTLSDVEFMFGMQYRQYIVPLVQAIFDQNVDQAMALVKTIIDMGGQADAVLATLIERLHECSMCLMLAQKNEWATCIPPAEILQLLYQIGLQGQQDLPFAPNPRIGLEVTVLRMLAFSPNDTAPVQPVKSVAQKTLIKVPGSIKTADEPKSSPMTASVPLKKEVIISQSDVTTAESWHQIVAALPVAGLAKILLKHCTVSKWKDNIIYLMLDEAQEACLNQDRQLQIQQALSNYLGKNIVLKITCGKSDEITPIQQDQKRDNQAKQSAKEMLLNDEKVQALMRTFDATIEQISCENEE